MQSWSLGLGISDQIVTRFRYGRLNSQFNQEGEGDRVGNMMVMVSSVSKGIDFNIYGLKSLN